MASINGTASNNILNGTPYDDFIYGRGGADVLSGSGGNDRLNGGTGGDTMYGGTGDDVYYVDSASDRAIEWTNQGYDTVRTSTHYALEYGSSIEQLMAANPLGTTAMDLIGNEIANRIRGNAGPNGLTGGGGSDILYGYAGNDTLIGGPGSDRLSGGAGQDVFVFTDLSWDGIYDFVSGQDSIDLGWFISPSEFDFIGAARFGGNPGEGRFSAGKFQLDLDGDSVADLSITITGTVDASDFDFAAYGAWDY